MKKVWDDESIDRLINMWNVEILTAVDIGAALEVSPSAIIGKIHRLITAGRLVESPSRLSANKAPGTYRAKRSFSKTPAVVAPGVTQVIIAPVARAPYVEKPAEIEAGVASLLALGAHACKWPIGTPKNGEEQSFCGRRAEKNRPYCVEHLRVGVARTPVLTESTHKVKGTYQARRFS